MKSCIQVDWEEMFYDFMEILVDDIQDILDKLNNN